MRPYMFLVNASGEYSLCMMEEHYPVSYQESELYQYWFVSTGKRSIIKCIQFQPLGDFLFNLCLLDYIPEKGELCDQSISNNGDVRLVLWTVAWCVEHHLNKFPEHIVVFSGNSMGRNKLYMRYIQMHRAKLLSAYIINILERNSDEVVFYVQKKVNL